MYEWLDQRHCVSVSQVHASSLTPHASTPPARSLSSPSPPPTLLLLAKQQTLPQCVPGGLSPQSRQPSWSLPRALRSCRLLLVSLWRARVLPAWSLIRDWGGWSVFVCVHIRVCVCLELHNPPPARRAAFKDQWFGQLAWQLQSHIRSLMTQWTSQWGRLSCPYVCVRVCVYVYTVV